MNPGRELDCAIAERVMGMRVQYSIEKLDHFVNWIEGVGSAQIQYAMKLPHYSTEIAAAWEVFLKAELVSVIHLDDGRWCATRDTCLNDDGDRDITRFAKAENYYETSTYSKDVLFAETAPHAICLAALKAVGAEL